MADDDDEFTVTVPKTTKGGQGRGQGGRLSDDPEAVERRLWYGARQREAAAALMKISHIAPWMPLPLPSDDDITARTSLEDIRLDNRENGGVTEGKEQNLARENKKTSNYQQNKAVADQKSSSSLPPSLTASSDSQDNKSVVAQPKAFTSNLLSMVDESIQRQQALYQAPVGRNLSVQKYESLGDDLNPKRWIHPLNVAAKGAMAMSKNRESGHDSLPGVARSKDSSPVRNAQRESSPLKLNTSTSTANIGINDDSKERKSKERKSKKQRKILLCFHGLASNHLYFEPWAAALDALEKERGQGQEQGQGQGQIVLNDRMGDTMSGTSPSTGTSKSTSTNIELWSVCLPGRSGRFLEPLTKSVHILAGCVGDAIISLGLLSPTRPPGSRSVPGHGSGSGPGSKTESKSGSVTGSGSVDDDDVSNICFVGHSVGALVAFETVRYLKENYSIHISLLYISCLPAPFVVSEANKDSFVIKRSELSDTLLLKKMREFGDTVFNKLYDQQYGHESGEQLIDVKGTVGAGGTDALLPMFLPLLRSDFQLLESYVMDKYLQEEEKKKTSAEREKEQKKGQELGLDKKIGRSLSGDEDDGEGKEDSSEDIGAGLKYCHLTTIVSEEDCVVVGDDYKGKNNPTTTKIGTKDKKNISTALVESIPGKNKISQEYLDSVQEWGQQLSGGTISKDGSEYFNIEFEKGGHHSCLLESDNVIVLLQDIIHKLSKNDSS